MYTIYSFFFMVWICVMMPVFLYKAWRFRKYLPGLDQRFGHLPLSLRFDGRPTIWFHSCSVGETLSVQTLVHELQQLLPEVRFVFSTITETGQAIARERFSGYGEGNSFYFPIDLASIGRRVLDWIKPAAIVIIDTEIWPNFLHQAHLRSIPIIMANGRISQQSFRFYRLARPLLRKVFTSYHVFLMASEEDAERIRMMGAPEDKIVVSGNMKYDMDLVEKELSNPVAVALDEALKLTSGGSDLIVAGCTHQGEEEVLIEVLRHLRRSPGLEQTRLLLVPRHPERFQEVTDFALNAGFHVQRRSVPDRQTSRSEIMVLDTMGELATAYSFATVAFVGGTLIPHGGHSIMEPARYAKPIVIGPSMQNFPQVIDDFLMHGAVRQIQATHANKERQVHELAQVFLELLKNEMLRESIGRAAYSVLNDSKGASRFTAQRIATLCKKPLSRAML